MKHSLKLIRACTATVLVGFKTDCVAERADSALPTACVMKRP